MSACVVGSTTTGTPTSLWTHRELATVERSTTRDERTPAGIFLEQQRYSFEGIGTLLPKGVSMLGAQRQNATFHQKALQTTRWNRLGQEAFANFTDPGHGFHPEATPAPGQVFGQTALCQARARTLASTQRITSCSTGRPKNRANS